MTLNGRDWELSSPYESTPFWNASRRIHFSFLRLEAVYDAHFFSDSRTRFTSFVAASPVLIAILHQRRHPERAKQRL